MVGDGVVFHLNSVLSRVDRLAMTRALGDYFIGKHVISEPSIIKVLLEDPRRAYFVIASDGIFGYCSRKGIQKHIGSVLEKNQIVGVRDIAKDLLSFALDDCKGKDNVCILFARIGT